MIIIIFLQTRILIHSSVSAFIFYYFTILVFTAIEDVGRPNRGPVKVKLCLGHNVGRGHLIFNQFTAAITAT